MFIHRDQQPYSNLPWPMMSWLGDEVLPSNQPLSSFTCSSLWFTYASSVCTFAFGLQRCKICIFIFYLFQNMNCEYFVVVWELVYLETPDARCHDYICCWWWFNLPITMFHVFHIFCYAVFLFVFYIMVIFMLYCLIFLYVRFSILEVCVDL